MKVIGYIRVSTEKQFKDGLSTQAQEDKIRTWADLNGYTNVEIFLDGGISGTVRDREGLTNLFESIKKNDILVVYSLSRLSRSTKHTLEISEKLNEVGADLVSITEKIDTTTPSGKMVFRILAVLNEFERDQTSERTKSILDYKKKKNERIGNIHYGYKLADNRVNLLVNDKEKETIDLVKNLKNNGLSLRKIANVLDEKGFVGRTGKKYNHSQVQRLVLA